jgi:acetoin utilization protein AcuB
MKVAQIMTRKLITVSPDESVERAVQLLRQRGVRHLLVLSDDELVGIVSDRDIKRAMDPQRAKRRKLLNIGGLFFLLEPIAVREIMTRDVVSIGPNASIKEAATVMVAERFGALPVVDNGELVGIITETDLLRYFAEAASDEPQRAQKSRGRKSRQLTEVTD